MRKRTSRLAAALLITLVVVASTLAFAEPRYLAFVAGALAIGSLIASRAGRKLLAALLVGAGIVAIVMLVRGPDELGFSPSAESPLPSVSILYSVEAEIAATTATLKEKITCNKQCELSMVGSLLGNPSLTSLRVADWEKSGTVDGSPIYVRSTVAKVPRTNHFGVDQASLPASIGRASVLIGKRQVLFEFVPAEGSMMILRAPKGAVGATDPPASEIFDLPGGRLERMSIKVVQWRSSSVDFDLLGSALRNPAGRQIYAISAWGFLPWMLSALVIFLVAFAAEYLKDLMRARFARDQEPPPPPIRAVGRARVPPAP